MDALEAEAHARGHGARQHRLAGARHILDQDVPLAEQRHQQELDLRALPDDCGAKMLLTMRPNDVAAVGFEQGAIDIDTPEDFERLTAKPD